MNHRDQPEIVGIARKLDELGFRLYATDGTAREIERLGTSVEIVGKLGRDNRVFQLLEDGKIDYVILTGFRRMKSRIYSGSVDPVRIT